ncbi:unnamed protein product [Didymodactylos carnosus]|uniref:Uncharacterized protein n=1 Tax=Didymodactylos carnosus TaxID=1234261 RepID=A0A814TX31_9BILA|nr:unnamed protein product [Didymodactylos carnosus]CAF1209198.1 unnamed protein product [Didymodactylos carnosus]CAF3931927.1 unnamed protein product [Didymodactylos carnosus]CAF4018274.1 unnamed protein product [Didymodactylos carnosus]
MIARPTMFTYLYLTLMCTAIPLLSSAPGDDTNNDEQPTINHYALKNNPVWLKQELMNINNPDLYKLLLVKRYQQQAFHAMRGKRMLG